MEFISQIFKLIEALAWPATTLFVLYYLRSPVISLLESLSDRIKDPRSDVAIGKDGLEIKNRLESLEIDQEQTKSLAFQALGVADSDAGANADISISTKAKIDGELKKLADDYLEIEHPSWSVRVRLKDAAARKMADLVITKSISRELLARQHHEGLILALAAASHTLPKSDDLEHLLHVADEVERLHVKYRIVMAMGRLFERGIAKVTDAQAACDVLTSYKNDADKSLLGRIAYTEKMIRNVGNS